MVQAKINMLTVSEIDTLVSIKKELVSFVVVRDHLFDDIDERIFADVQVRIDFFLALTPHRQTPRVHRRKKL